jgi:hypothetical protein
VKLAMKKMDNFNVFLALTGTFMKDVVFQFAHTIIKGSLQLVLEDAMD